jgi:hypothetical protein
MTKIIADPERGSPYATSVPVVVVRVRPVGAAVDFSLMRAPKSIGTYGSKGSTSRNEPAVFG